MDYHAILYFIILLTILGLADSLLHAMQQPE